MHTLQTSARTAVEATRKERSRKYKNSQKSEANIVVRNRLEAGLTNEKPLTVDTLSPVGLGLALRSISLPSVHPALTSPSETSTLTSSVSTHWPLAGLTPLDTKNLGPPLPVISPTNTVDSLISSRNETRRMQNRSAESPTNISPTSRWPLRRSRSTSGNSFNSLIGNSPKREAPLPAIPKS